MPNYTRHEEINHVRKLIAGLDLNEDATKIADLQDRLMILSIKNTRHTIAKPKHDRKRVYLT